MPEGVRPVDVMGPDMETYAELVRKNLREEWGARAPQPPTNDFRVDALAGIAEVRFYLMWVGDRAVGAAELRLTDQIDETAASCIVRVDSDYRGYGFGQRLSAHCESVAKMAGRTRIRGMSSGVTMRDDRNTRFVKRQGYTQAVVNLRQDLELPLHPPSPSDAFNDTFELFVVEGVPSLSICEAIAEMESALYAEDELGLRGGLNQRSGPALQQSYAQFAAGGRSVVVTIIRHRATDDLVGVCEWQYMSGAARAEQYETYVRPEFRTAEVAMRIQAAGIMALSAAHDDMVGIRAFNSTGRPELIEANRMLGFEDVGYYREWTKDI